MDPIDGHATLTELDAVADELAWLEPAPFFFGASVLPLYLDDSTLAEEARPTDDVDVIVAIVAPGPMHLATANLEAEMRARGWTHDLRPGRRNIHAFVSPSGVPVDLVLHRPSISPSEVPTVEDWPLHASSAPLLVHRANGRLLRVPTPAYFLACKIVASRNPKRWTGPYDAKDVEDIALLIAGCGSVLDSTRASPPELRALLAAWASEVRNGSTTYGKNVRELLLANAPRESADVSSSDSLRWRASPSDGHRWEQDRNATARPGSGGLGRKVASDQAPVPMGQLTPVPPIPQ